MLLALVPLAKAKLIDVDDLVIEAKSGVTGSGRGLKQNTLFSEAGEGLSAYAVGFPQALAGNRAGDRDRGRCVSHRGFYACISSP